MAKQIASLHAQIGASATGFTAALDKIEAKAKSAERVVNGTKMTATVEAKTANLDRVEQRARALDRQKTTIKVDADTKAAGAKLDALRNKARAGFTLPGSLNPAQIGLGILSGAVMRALTASEEGKKFGDQLNLVVVNVLSPLLKALTPAVTALVPVTEGLGRAIGQATGWIQQLARVIPQVPPTAPPPPPGENMFTSPSTFFGGMLADFNAQLGPMLAAQQSLQETMTEAANAAARFFENVARMATARQSLESQLFSEAQQLAGVTPFQAQMTAYETAFQQHIKTIQGGLDSLIANVPAFAGGGAGGWMAQAQQLLLGDLQADHDMHVRRLTEMQRELSLIRQMNEMRQRATQLGERVSPLQQFQRAIVEIERLDRREAFTGVENGRNEAMFRALETFRNQQPPTVQASVGVMERDATSTASAILAAQRAQRGGNTDLLSDIRNLQREAAVRDERHLEATREVARAIQALGLGGPEPRELR